MADKLSLKDLALDVKNSIVEGKDLDLEEYTESLSKKSGINQYDIKDLYNQLFLIQNTTVDYSVKRRHWTDVEDSLIVHYINMSKKVGKSVTESLKDLEELLVARTASSLGFRFYNVLTKNSKSRKSKRSSKKNTPVKKTSRVQKSLDIIEEPTSIETDEQDAINKVYEQSKQATEVIEATEVNNGDLIDVVAEIVENVDSANVDVESLFKGILNLSRKAVVGNNDAERVKALEKDLEDERAYSKQLKAEYNLLMKDLEVLKDEIKKYNEMSSKDKMKNFREYNNTVKYIVGKFGTVEKIEEKQPI